ncbi:MAG: hypothetical protein M1829_004583 [Trizodia sp. TS-e1964]|nr:MAG: hypothetical protein M1829_004583 [Trizodia sp. TS-e1964]
MNKSIEQALNGMIPAHNGPLPPDLVELATSLLAQSRTAAGNLKADEEIARSYACANIACERLKQILNLPKISPQPPCPPRVYAKLYAYLESAMPSRSTRGPYGAPTITPKPSPSKPRLTPSKPLSAPSTPSRKRKSGLRHETAHPEVPAWIMPTIRYLCKVLNAPAAPPHILAGVTSILTLPAPFLSNNTKAPHADKKDKIPALIIAVYFFIKTRLLGEAAEAGDYQAQRRLLMKILVAEDSPAKDVQEKIVTDDVDAWLREISERGWLRLDWFGNVVEGSGLEIHSDESEETQMEAQAAHSEMNAAQRTLLASKKHARPMLLPGLRTMMQDELDYLSAARRLDYLSWKKDIMKRIEDIEKKQPPDPSSNL